MLIQTLVLVLLPFTMAFLDFFQNHFKQQQQQQQHQGIHRSPEDFENVNLNARCDRFLCPDTGICVDTPKSCPCPFPLSQLRCVLPNGNYLCISKPAGDEFYHDYENPATNWKMDAKNDNVRDCGWVSRAYLGKV